MNLPTFIVGACVAAVFLTVVIRGIINRKKGKSSCSCSSSSCSGCALNGACRKTK